MELNPFQRASSIHFEPNVALEEYLAGIHPSLVSGHGTIHAWAVHVRASSSGVLLQNIFAFIRTLSFLILG